MNQIIDLFVYIVGLVLESVGLVIGVGKCWFCVGLVLIVGKCWFGDWC